MAAPTPAPTRLRRRLTVAFVLLVGVSTSGLAVATYAVVRDARLADSLERAEREARLGLRLAAGLGPGADLRQFAEGFEARGVHASIVDGTERVDSDPAVAPPISPALRANVARGQVAFERLSVDGRPYLAIGGRPLGSSTELYLLVPEIAVVRDLQELRGVLVLGTLATTVLAALVGWLVARRTLAPVARAARAAQAVADGLLETRLPETGGDEFAAWSQSFNEMAAALQARIADLTETRARERRFTSDVAHELRTPLTALVAEASLLAEHLEAMPPDARRPAELLVGDVGRLRRLVEDLMTISRFDAGREDVRLGRVDLTSLVAATVRARGWDEVVALDGEGATIRSDARRIERVVANLVENAIEHGRGRDVRVRVGREGRSAVVEVSDRGPGIGAEHLPHVFERLYKADPARGGGSGLGLAIALEDARLLGGGIEARSDPGRGSRFTLRLPVTEPLHAGDGPVAIDRDDGVVPSQEVDR